jgi:exopolysaccharide biosynthesis polyprenyl glycosylphosphotransferase
LQTQFHEQSRNIIIVGESFSIPFIDSFIVAKDWGYKINAIVSNDIALKGKYEDSYFIIAFQELRSYVTNHPIDDIFYCLPLDDNQFDLEKLIEESDEIGVTVHIMQQCQIRKQLMSGNKHTEFNYNFVTHQTIPDNYIGLKLKDLFDIVFSVFVLIVVWPLMALIAYLIKSHDGGPIFFKQERIGLNGRRFNCYKFRTMVINAEELITHLSEKNEADGPVFKIQNDPRITKIGHWLRKTSLDELPQFFNVIKGEMSVVGPRPPLLKEVMQYERTQLRRLSMKPGITCSWQVWGRHQVSFKEWMQMDLDYIDNWSIKLDARIIIATVTVVFRADGQ